MFSGALHINTEFPQRNAPFCQCSMHNKLACTYRSRLRSCTANRFGFMLSRCVSIDSPGCWFGDTSGFANLALVSLRLCMHRRRYLSPPIFHSSSTSSSRGWWSEGFLQGCGVAISVAMRTLMDTYIRICTYDYHRSLYRIGTYST